MPASTQQSRCPVLKTDPPEGPTAQSCHPTVLTLSTHHLLPSRLCVSSLSTLPRDSGLLRHRGFLLILQSTPPSAQHGSSTEKLSPINLTPLALLSIHRAHLTTHNSQDIHSLLLSGSLGEETAHCLPGEVCVHTRAASLPSLFSPRSRAPYLVV